MVIIHEVTQGTDEWQTLRSGKYTGSNAHKLLRFGTIEYARAETGTFTGNFYTKRGHVLEEEAVGLYEAIKGRRVLRPGFITNTAYKLCGYSPDGLDGSTLLEVKCFNKQRHKAIAKGEIPVEIMAQIQFGLVICGLRKARLILYNPDFAKKTIFADDQEIPNPEYNLKLALVMIDIKYSRNVHSNLKRILTKEAVYALHP